MKPDSQWLFVGLTVLMVLLAMGAILRPAWRSLRQGGTPAQPAAWITPVALAVAVPALAFALYSWKGDWSAARGDRDVLSEQLIVGAAHAGDSDGRAYSELERHLKRQPGDSRAWVFKARLDMDAQRYEQAAAGFAMAVAGRSKAANDPAIWVEYAEARGMAQGRTLVGEPLKLVEKALSIDPNHAAALDLAGSAAWEMKDFRQAASHWQLLLQQVPPGTARHNELARAIERAQQRAKVSLPATTG